MPHPARHSKPHNLSGDDIAKLRFLSTLPYVACSTLVWVIHDYFITLEDEVKYFWSGRSGFGAFFFFWIRYYTIFLVAYDTLSIHVFPGPKTVIANSILSAISLWSIEIIMQLRVYILFNRSKRVAFVNGTLFVISIGFFIWFKVDNALHAMGTRPKRGRCATGDTRWAQWIPATLFEFMLFEMVVYKTIVSYGAKSKLNGRQSLGAILLHGNVVYFFVVACVLVLSNLMLVCATRIPYLGLGLFHATLGIATCRMLIHLRKFNSENLEGGPEGRMPFLNLEVNQRADVVR